MVLEVLDTVEGGELTDSTIEGDNGDDGPGKASSTGSDLVPRWVRIACCAVNLAGTVDGFNWTENTREWRVEGKLSESLRSGKSRTTSSVRRKRFDRWAGSGWTTRWMSMKPMQTMSLRRARTMKTTRRRSESKVMHYNPLSL